ncbi:MAG: hypothetical protein MUP58_01960 [Candidatus Nanohaloarchaeota archaeon QJJ-9]|nr:hypothetical protein [Candidatus Nanohaloarchaeota archaeon QJJ-9]
MKKIVAAVIAIIFLSSILGLGTGAGEKNTTSSLQENSSQKKLELPFFGQIETENTSIIALTALISFVDGFNPCSLWVLTFLLGLVIHSGSRKKTAAVGLTFLAVTSIGYGAFVYGLVNVFSYISHLTWIKVAVALVAFVFGAVNIKDFFYFGEGISFTIPDRFKPKIAEKLSDTVRKDSLIATLIGTAIIAAGIVLVELPCTAGFPLVYSNILASRGIGASFALALLGLYMLIYLLDELAVFLGITWTMEKTRFEEKHGRYLKLLGGTIMVALGAALLWKPELMESLRGTVYVFGSAIIVSGLIAYLYRKIEKRGGTE